MSKSTEERIDNALWQLLERTVPIYPEDDDETADQRLDDAFAFARNAIASAADTAVGPDVHHAADLIKRRLIRDNLSPEKALKFSNLYSRLLSQPVLSQKWAMLYFLHSLTDAPTAENRQSMANHRRSHSPTVGASEERKGRQYVVDSSAFNEAFSNAGLLRLPATEEPRQERPASRQRRERTRDAEPEAEPPPPSPSYPNYDALTPPEPALLRDLPFTLQGLSSTNLVFSSSKILKLPPTLPVPVIGLLHTLAEPCLLYRGLSEFVESSSGGLVGQSFRSALSIELRAYLGLVATLEGQIRRALAQLDDGPRQGIGKAGVTLKRCVVWTREATMGLRLMSLMVEQSKDKKGGQLISVIHSFALTHGDPFVVNFAERLLSHVTRPFYDMLRQWIYDGELSDPHLEFFVSEQQEKLDDTGKGGATSVWEDKYKLNAAMVPSIITDSFANKVFLIGKSLNFIRHGCNDASWVESYSKSASRELHYGDTATLETSIDEAYKTTMARLITLMENKFHLFEHLSALKKYLLLGAGDFIAVLMESLSANLDRPANTQYRHTLTAQLEHAVRNSNAQHDSPDVLRRLDSRMLELSHGEIGWDVFTLEYKISPPVDVIVTPFGSKQYLKVFNFLWRVKRVEFALGTTWRRCMTGARGVLGAVTDRVGGDWKSARCVVAEMVHFVNQLQYYILFEVIESSWGELQEAMRRPDSTLDDLIAAHAAYLTAITRKGLLGASAVDFPGQLHELLKTMLAYKDAFTRRQERSAKIENRTAAGKWGLSERDDDIPTPIAAPHGLGLASVSEDDILGGLRGRLAHLAADFKARVNVLLGDLYAQPDTDMRWLAMVMNFNDVYSPVRRKRHKPLMSNG
ncbi:spindle pole body component alp6 [Trichodelitschia bisporula]|uniref:Spindle pole body component alp6 n=1 Tax=Trichodelitschia bisporula TaxID=703511 RepID=A0A6G1HUB4_9PEZI|nr:spindle pole body component alp6 [Trichodelitschia bisporula]